MSSNAHIDRSRLQMRPLYGAIPLLESRHVGVDVRCSFPKHGPVRLIDGERLPLCRLSYCRIGSIEGISNNQVSIRGSATGRSSGDEKLRVGFSSPIIRKFRGRSLEIIIGEDDTPMRIEVDVAAIVCGLICTT